MDSPIPATLTTLPVKLILSINIDQLDNWYDIQHLMRAYQVPENSNTTTTRRFQKLMFRAEARKLKALADSGYVGYPVVDSMPPITAACWAILMGDVEVALSAIEEYQVHGSEHHLYDTGWLKLISADLSSSNNPQRNMAKIADPTPLMLAVLSGNIDMLKAIVNRCPDVNRNENTEGLSCLNEWRAAIDSSTLVTSCKITALDLAAWQGRKDMVKL